MKKILATLFIVILMLTTVGCVSKNNSNEYDDSGYTEEELDEFKNELHDLLMGATQSTVEKALGSPKDVDSYLYFYWLPKQSLTVVITYTFDGHDRVVDTVFFL